MDHKHSSKQPATFFCYYYQGRQGRQGSQGSQGSVLGWILKKRKRRRVKWLSLWRPCLPKIYCGGPDYASNFTVGLKQQHRTRLNGNWACLFHKSKKTSNLH
jgi:hypothetical protein